MRSCGLCVKASVCSFLKKMERVTIEEWYLIFDHPMLMVGKIKDLIAQDCKEFIHVSDAGNTDKAADNPAIKEP